MGVAGIEKKMNSGSRPAVRSVDSGHQRKRGGAGTHITEVKAAALDGCRLRDLEDKAQAELHREGRAQGGVGGRMAPVAELTSALYTSSGLKGEGVPETNTTLSILKRLRKSAVN